MGQGEPTLNPRGEIARRTIGRLLHPVAVLVVAAYLTILVAGGWGLEHLFPDTVVLNLFGHVHRIEEAHRRILGQTFEACILLPAVFFLEYAWEGWAGSSVRHLLFQRTPSGWSDLACYLFENAPASALVSAVMSFGVVCISGGWLRQRLVAATGVDLTIAGAPLALQVATLFVVFTFFDYWSHRLDHSDLFWPLHRFHHSAESFSVLTAARVHPAVFTAVVGATLPAVLLGSSKAALVDVALAIVVIRLVIHSRIDSDFGWIGRWLVQSPRHHRLHHCLNQEPTNLALTPLWDRLFGTWRETPAGAIPIGVETPYRHGLWAWPDMWRDYCEFWRDLARRLRPAAPG